MTNTRKENGYKEWQNILCPHWTAIRSYDWCDRILVLDESKGRRVIHSGKFTEFDLSFWIETTKP